MSWFSNLTETYDRVSSIAGVPDENDKVLLPLNHMTVNTDVCVTINGEGGFLRAEADKKPVSVCVPCTEDSASRSANVTPHPLHENLGYLTLDEKKHNAYLELLSSWRERHPKANAVYKYILGGTLINDLTISKIEKLEEKLFIRFRVENVDDYADIWKDPSLIRAWQEFYAEADTREKVLCYSTGSRSVPMVKHPKGVHSPYNAKLISCNDDTNYTYRGRFTESGQANAVSTEASQKAHWMLKYLVSTQGYKCDTQAVVAWATDDGERQPSPFMDTYNLYGTLTEDNENQAEPKDASSAFRDARSELGANYVKRFRNALGGYGGAKKLDTSRRVAVLALDSATTGRMGITFYQDLSKNEYKERLIAWHESCCWWFYRGKNNVVSAPGADNIIEAVYGEPKGEGYKKIKKQARERLLHNVVCREPIDRAWIKAAVNRVSQPLSYSKDEKSGGGWSKWSWEDALNTTCAMVRKFYSKDKEAFSLELDTSCNDRSYLFGRLLAIADRIESYARYLQTGGDDTEKRPTNAVRYMSKFAAKPFRTWNLIYTDQLNPYIQRLNGAEWYQRQIDEIMISFCEGDFESGDPLDGKYLLGYSLQRRAFQKNKTEDKNEGDNGNEFNEKN